MPDGNEIFCNGGRIISAPTFFLGIPPGEDSLKPVPKPLHQNQPPPVRRIRNNNEFLWYAQGEADFASKSLWEGGLGESPFLRKGFPQGIVSGEDDVLEFAADRGYQFGG